MNKRDGFQSSFTDAVTGTIYWATNDQFRGKWGLLRWGKGRQPKTLHNYITSSRETKDKKQREGKANTHQAGGCREPTQPSWNQSLGSKQMLGTPRCCEPGKVRCPKTAGRAQPRRETHSSGGQSGHERWGGGPTRAEPEKERRRKERREDTERKGPRRKRWQKQGSVGGRREGRLTPAAPALCVTPTSRSVMSTAGRRAQDEARSSRAPRRCSARLQGTSHLSAYLRSKEGPSLHRAPGLVSAHKESPWRRRASADWWSARAELRSNPR